MPPFFIEIRKKLSIITSKLRKVFIEILF